MVKAFAQTDPAQTCGSLSLVDLPDMCDVPLAVATGTVHQATQASRNRPASLDLVRRGEGRFEAGLSMFMQILNYQNSDTITRPHAALRRGVANSPRRSMPQLVAEAVRSLMSIPVEDFDRGSAERAAATLTRRALQEFYTEVECRFEPHWWVMSYLHQSFRPWLRCIVLLQKVDDSGVAESLSPPRMYRLDGATMQKVYLTDDEVAELDACIGEGYFEDPSEEDRALYERFKEAVGLRFPEYHPDVQREWEQSNAQ